MDRIKFSCTALLIAATMGLALGCEEKPAPTPAPAKPAAAPPKADPDHHDHVHGAGHDLGSLTIGGFTLKVSQEHAIEEGKDAGFEIAVSGGTGKPSAIRAWIGTEDAKGSVKAKAVTEDDHFDAHIETPKPIPAGANLWLEAEDSAGKKSVGSIAYK